jgi:hypothetical protein
MKRIVAAMLLVSCGGASADADWAGSVETLPNGATRTVNTAQGLWRDSDAWRLVPELRIGAVEGTGPAVFSAISGMQVHEDGRIYVLDRQANELRIFSPDGSHLRTVGRSGGGPGEYSAANGLLWLAPDSLLVVDQRGNRYSVLTDDGDYVRQVPRHLGFYGWAFNGGLADGRVYERSSVAMGPDDQRPVLLGTALRTPDSESRDPAQPAAGEPGPGTAVVDTVWLPVPDGPLFESFSVRNERGGMVMGVPFAASPLHEIDDEGTLWHGHGSTFRLIRSELQGDTLAEIVLDASPAAVTAEELAEWEQGQAVTRFREMGGRLDMDRIPKVKPYFDDLLRDPEGNVWVSIPADPTTAVFAVFDDVGRYLGRLEIPGISRDVYLPSPIIRNGRLHIVARDELDVQHVYVFAIEKGER